MAEVLLHMKPAAEAELKKRREQIMAWRKMDLITSDQARAKLHELSQEFMRREMMDEGDRNIGVRCKDCQRLHIMPSDVTNFRCKCSPDTERPTHVNQVILT